jgi:hypothetical protein
MSPGRGTETTPTIAVLAEFSLAAGFVQAITGEPTMASLILTIIGPTVISLWLLLMGVLIWRRAAAIGGLPVAA